MRQINLFYLICCLTAIVVTSIPVLAQQSASQSSPPALGKLVDIGGRRLHINCMGKGRPTVILEAGSGDFSFDWSLVQPQIAKFARTCSYDRAGYAWSDAGPMPRTMKQIVYELHTALEKAEIKPPYLMVGHSRGGLFARVFAKQYQKEVIGMVLIDASHEDHLTVITDRKTHKDEIVRERELAKGIEIPPVQVAMPNSANSDASQERRPAKISSPYDKLPSEIQKLHLWAKSQGKYDDARVSETFDFFAEEAAEVFAERSKGGYSLGSIPLIVLTRGIPNDEEKEIRHLLEDHDRLQRDLATLSSNSKQILAQKSGHHIQLDEPQLVIDSVRQVSNAAKRSSKLH